MKDITFGPNQIEALLAGLRYLELHHPTMKRDYTNLLNYLQIELEKSKQTSLFGQSESGPTIKKESTGGYCQGELMKSHPAENVKQINTIR